MRVKFATTIDDNIIKGLKKLAIDSNLNVNDVIENIARQLLNGEIALKFMDEEIVSLNITDEFMDTITPVKKGKK